MTVLLEELLVSTPMMDEAAKVFATPRAYTDESNCMIRWRICARMPRVVGRVPNYRPFRAITKHADIVDIERATNRSATTLDWCSSRRRVTSSRRPSVCAP